jgi:hypothetical protein
MGHFFIFYEKVEDITFKTTLFPGQVYEITTPPFAPEPPNSVLVAFEAAPPPPPP